MNRLIRMLLVAGLLVLLAACTTSGTLSILSAALGGGGGMSDEEKAEAVVKSARAVAKSFEDITPEQEYYIGRAVGAVVLDRYRPHTNQKANHYLNVLGRTLSLVSDRPETFGGYHFFILDSEEINAFATPSGLIFVSLGMLRCASSEDAVAAILAHEIGHIELKHGLKAIKTSRITTALTSAALTGVAVAGSNEMAELTTAFEDSITDITSTMINSGYSRSSELQADKSAVRILQAAGYNPWALVEMLEVMEQRLQPGGLDFAKTHPKPELRIREIEKTLTGIEKNQPVYPQRQSRYRSVLGEL